MTMKSPRHVVRLPMAPDAPDFRESPVPDENEISIPWGDNYFLYWDKSHWTLAMPDGDPWFAIYLPRFATMEELIQAVSRGVRERE
jgi:hypothetical protein